MAVRISGPVVGHELTANGNARRVFLGSGLRVNDLVMVPASAPEPKVGESFDAEVDPRVETTADGRPTKNIVYWLRGGWQRRSKRGAPADAA